MTRLSRSLAIDRRTTSSSRGRPIPSQAGDVLILWTDQTFSIHAVGRVFRDGEQDFSGHADVEYLNDRADAVAKARTLVAPGRRIFCCDIDTGAWSDIADPDTPPLRAVPPPRRPSRR